MKTALVTGAARGIGLATTRAFLAAGWQVAMVDRDADELASVASQLSGVFPIIADVSNPQDVNTMVRTAADWGGIDALVNNAGVADFGPMEETDFARWRRVMDRRAARVMAERGRSPA